MIQSLAEAAIKGRKYEAEAFVMRTVTNAIYIDGSKISNAETKTDIGMSFRLSKGNRQGRASLTVSDEKDVRDCVAMAEQVAKFSPPVKDFKGYPQPRNKNITPKKMLDKRIENIDTQELMEIAVSVVDACDADIPRGLLRVSAVESAVINTNGLTAGHRGTMMYAHFTSMTKLEHPGEGTETLFGTSLSIDPEAVGRSLSEKARSAAIAKPFKGRRELTMILPPSELGDMLMSSAGSSLNGENVLYGRSLWKDKTGEQVASKQLTLKDDPMTPGPLCSSFDDEGTPSSKKVLVDKGILRSFLRDSFVGDSTGNGMRRSSVESQGIYENPVSIKPMNLVLSAGRYSQEDIIGNTDDGILIEKFAWPEADPLTGRFGLEIRSGHLIKNGEITETINNALMMGNMISALKNAEMIGNDVINMGCVSVPTVSFSVLELIGN